MASVSERRFLVSALDPQLHASVLRDGRHIRQGYFDTSPWRLLRVRLTTVSEHGGDGARTNGYLTSKTGVGAAREVEETPVNPETARWLLAQCPYRLEKRRLEAGGWKIDAYLGALGGLIIAEQPEGAAAGPPPGVTLGAELTDAANNYHLARMAGDLSAEGGSASGGDGSISIQDAAARLHHRPGRIVFTGAPCSGKSTILEELKSARAGLLHCVPEVATIVISQVGVRPTPDPIGMRAFNRSIYRVQRSFEDASLMQAAQDGKKAALFDRGTCDIAAYLGGVGAFERICGTSIRYEYACYDLVVCLEPPPPDVYARMKSNNAARSETYTEVEALDTRIMSAWASHPRFVYVRNGASWEEKKAAALEAVDSFLASR